MNKMATLQTSAETRDKLKQLAKQNKRSIGKYLDVVIEELHKKNFSKTTVFTSL